MRPAASLFQLFKLGGGKFAFNLTGDDKEAQARAGRCSALRCSRATRARAWCCAGSRREARRVRVLARVLHAARLVRTRAWHCRLLAQAEANELETELLLELDQRLLLQSGSIYTRLAREGWHDDDNAAGDAAAWRQQAAEEEEEEASSSDGGDDEGEAAHSAAVRRAKAKARGGFKWTKATVLAALVRGAVAGGGGRSWEAGAAERCSSQQRRICS